MKKLMIAATHSGAGKTTFTLGLMYALTQRRLRVQPFKVGPDYIDTGWHRLATGSPSYNLDAFLMPASTLAYLFQSHTNKADISIIEGVMGLYDGFGIDPYYCSSAGLAKALECPILLVVDGKSVSTSIAATILGFQQFQQSAPLVGVVINRVNTDSHYQLLKQAIEHYTHLPVLGRLPHLPELLLPERHLGLIPAKEGSQQQYWQRLGEVIEQHIDLEKLLLLSGSSSLCVTAPSLPISSRYQGLTMAIAHDAAFHFYYEDNLHLLRQLGLQLAPFSPLTDTDLPACDLIYIGGGYPEVFAEQLSQNSAMLFTLQQAHQQGTPIYAECGGLMYLGEQLITQDKQRYQMVGLLSGYSQMSQGLKRFGYCQAQALMPTLLANSGDMIKGHEFHHSEFITDLPCAFQLTKIRDGECIKQWQGGYQLGNTLASYLHVHFYQHPMMLCHWLDKAIS